MMIVDMSAVKLPGDTKQNNLPPECGQPIDAGRLISLQAWGFPLPFIVIGGVMFLILLLNRILLPDGIGGNDPLSFSFILTL
jgi:hypothetical protein